MSKRYSVKYDDQSAEIYKSIDGIFDRLVKAGICSVEELIDACDQQKSVPLHYLQGALNDNPFIGRPKHFQDLIESVVLGKYPGNKGR